MKIAGMLLLETPSPLACFYVDLMHAHARSRGKLVRPALLLGPGCSMRIGVLLEDLEISVVLVAQSTIMHRAHPLL